MYNCCMYNFCIYFCCVYEYDLYFLRLISSCKLSKYRIKKKLCLCLHIKKDFCTRVPLYIYTQKKYFYFIVCY